MAKITRASLRYIEFGNWYDVILKRENRKVGEIFFSQNPPGDTRGENHPYINDGKGPRRYVGIGTEEEGVQNFREAERLLIQALNSSAST